MRIAFIGLGAMGLPIARRLASVADVELILYDLSRDRLDLAQPLGRIARSVAEATAEADAVFSVLPADRHVESVVADIAVAARPGQIYVDFSTIAPATMNRAAE